MLKNPTILRWFKQSLEMVFYFRLESKGIDLTLDWRKANMTHSKIYATQNSKPLYVLTRCHPTVVLFGDETKHDMDNTLGFIHFFAENVKPKKPIDLAILKTDQQDLLDDDASLDSDEDDEDDKDDLDDLGDDTELADDPNTEDDEEDEDDYDEGDDWDTTPSSTTYVPKLSTTTSAPTTTAKNTPLPTPDPYFTHFDPRNEHQSYKEAQVFRQ